MTLSYCFSSVRDTGTISVFRLMKRLNRMRSAVSNSVKMHGKEQRISITIVQYSECNDFSKRTAHCVI